MLFDRFNLRFDVTCRPTTVKLLFRVLFVDSDRFNINFIFVTNKIIRTANLRRVRIIAKRAASAMTAARDAN